MDGYINLAALAAGCAAILGLCLFWLQRGATEAKTEARAEIAASAAAVAVAKHELLATDLGTFKVEVASKYITSLAVSQIEARLASELHRISDDVKASLAEMTKRFDQLTTTLIENTARKPTSRKQ